MNGIEQISDVAFMKRFIKCNAWFQWITENIIPSGIVSYQKPEILKPYHVVAIDGSDVYTKGAVKQAWHLHYSIDLFSLNCNQFKITEKSIGETLKFYYRKKRFSNSRPCLCNYNWNGILSGKWRRFYFKNKKQTI